LESYDQCYADCQEVEEKIQVIGCGGVGIADPPVGFACAVILEFLKYEGCRWACSNRKPPPPCGS
jgi:hypothetical protein